MQHGYFQKKGDPGIKGKSKVKIFASMLLYADMQHDHILKKLILYKPMWPRGWVHFIAPGYKLGRGPLGDAT